jgi:hypothetical protein
MRGRHTWFAFLLVVASAAALATATAAQGGWNYVPSDQWNKAYNGTDPFHSVAAVQAAGYGEFRDAQGIACIEHMEMGAMGIHYVNGSLLDTTIDPARPEAVVYEPGTHGSLNMVALEYIVFADAWTAAGHTGPPRLFNQDYLYTPAPNRYGIPAFWALHIWIWKYNPSGLFAPYNPRVVCPSMVS